MSVPLILTLLAGAATFIGAFLGVLGQKPSNRVLAFSLGFAAGIMLLISLMEMLPAALDTEGCRLYWATGCLLSACWATSGWIACFLTLIRRIWCKKAAAASRLDKTHCDFIDARH